MSERQLGEKNHMYGKTISDETKEKLRQANIGRIITNEWRQKIGKANTGKTRSEESKEQNRQAHLGKIMESTRGENHHNYGNHSYNYKGGSIVINNDRLSFRFYNNKEITKSFSINKYGYVLAMKNCLDLMFEKNNYFNKRIKKLN